MSIIDSFFVALGYDYDPRGLRQLEAEATRAKDTLLSLGGVISAALAGIAVKEIAKIGAEFETTKIQIAGFFDALGQSPDFNTALEDADATMNQIAAAAAALPGEAEEYQAVFLDTFAFVKGAVGGTLTQMTDFTNQLTAIGKTAKIDAGQIAREANELLATDKGRAMGRNVLWRKLFPLMRKLDGQAKLTSESFNKMTEVKRADLMRRAFARMQPMLKASANSFDAMWGAAVSGLKKLVRLGSAGMFEGMKKGLQTLTGLFFDADFNVTALGKDVVDGFKKIGRMITTVVVDLAMVVEWFAKSKYGAMALKVVLGFLAAQLAALAFSKVAGTVSMLVKQIFNLKRALTGGLLIAMGLIIEDLYQFYTGGESVTGLLVKKWAPAIYLIKGALGLLAAALLRTQIKAAASMAKVAFAFVSANLPLVLIIGTLAALAAGIYYVVTRWQTFGAGAKTAIVAVTTVLGVLAAAFVATKAAAIGAALSSAAAWLATIGPILLVGLAVAALGVVAYETGEHWDEVVQVIKDNWTAFVVLVQEVPGIGLLVAAVGLAKNWDEIIDGMKAKWNGFAETINKLGIITLPTFAEKPAMLPAGEGVRLPQTGPAQGPWAQRYDQGPVDGQMLGPSKDDAAQRRYDNDQRRYAATPTMPPGGADKNASLRAAAAAMFGMDPNSSLSDMAKSALGAMVPGMSGGAPALAGAGAGAPGGSFFSGMPSYLIPPASAGAQTTTKTTHVRIDKVEIKTDDPQRMGNELERQIIRASQSGVGL